MKKNIIYIILLLSIIFNGLLAYYVQYHDKIIPLKQSIKSNYNLNQEDNKWVIKIVGDIQSEPFDNPSDLFDAVRNYIHHNSRHKEGSYYHQNRAFITDSVMKDLYQIAHGLKDSLPDLSCSPRAWAMRRVLKAMDIETRIVMLYQVRDAKVFSHTVMEAYNKDDENWELHDPDVNLFFVDTLNHTRITYLGMKDMNVANYLPCNGDSCSWDLTYYDFRDKSMFAAVQVHYLKENFKDQMVLIDSKALPKEDILILKAHFAGSKNILVY